MPVLVYREEAIEGLEVKVGHNCLDFLNDNRLVSKSAELYAPILQPDNSSCTIIA